jgi:hypothetical protein
MQILGFSGYFSPVPSPNQIAVEIAKV